MRNVTKGQFWDRVAGGAAAWITQEQERWGLWIPVFWGIGVAAYFSLSFEPHIAVGCLIVGVPALAVLLIRGVSQTAVMVSIVFLIAALGFTAAQLRTIWVAAPILQKEAGALEVEGTILSLEDRGNSRRILLSSISSAEPALSRPPERIRVTVSSSISDHLRPGQRVKLRAVLRPPPAPAAPGAYDFARQAYFERLGAVGYAVSQIETIPQRNSLLLNELVVKWRVLWEKVRVALDRRIRDSLEGQTGAVASALMTGLRGSMNGETNAIMRDAGLAHLLAISGLHMGIVAGWIFFLVRAGLALVPSLALNYPIKKWAASIAILAAFFYLFLAGASLPTLRAFLMAGVVFLAVIIDRRAITLRIVAWAAGVILVFAPESLLSASFQLSFAAVVALVSFYEWWTKRKARTARQRHLIGQLCLYLAGVGMTSIIASLATAPFVIHNFNRLALYGLLANLVGVPLTALWIMPWAIVAMLLLPFGLEGIALSAMGWGIELLLSLASWISQLPGAVAQFAALPRGALPFIVLGGLWLCVWQSRWRLAGLAMIAAGIIWAAVFGAKPDFFVNEDGRLAAVRLPSDVLAVSDTRSGRFERSIWMRLAGAQGYRNWEQEPRHVSCDELACIVYRKNIAIAYVKHAAALEEDCARADVVISTLPFRHIACSEPEVAVDRFDFWRNGAYSVTIDAGRVRVTSVREARGERPWVLKPEKRR